MHEKPVSTLKTEEVVSPSENARHRIHGIIDEYRGILRQSSTAFALFCHYLICLDKELPIRIIKIDGILYIGEDK